MSEGLPTAEDFVVYGSVDERSACQNFLGKSVEEAAAMFARSPVFAEDLMWMGPRAFVYYVVAATRYLASDAALGDDDFASWIHAVIRFRAKNCELSRDVTGLSRAADLTHAVLGRFDSVARDAVTREELHAEYRQLNHELRAALVTASGSRYR